jgi:hypothetical protein
MKLFLSLVLPKFSCHHMELIRIDGVDMYLVHDIYTWLGFSFVGESILFECFHDAVAQVNKL